MRTYISAAKGSGFMGAWKNPYQGRLLKTIEKQSRNNSKQSGMANFTHILMSCCSVEQATGKWTSHKCSRSSWELVFIRQVFFCLSHNQGGLDKLSYNMVVWNTVGVCM